MLNKTKSFITGISLLALMSTAIAETNSVNQLQERVAQLEAELQNARMDLYEARSSKQQTQAELEEAKATIAEAAPPAPSKIQFDGPFGGTWKIGGAIRANYYLGDYSDPNGSVDGTRGDTGTISLDIFRVNVDYVNNDLIGKFEYRFYPGYRGSNQDSYQFPHTAWLGYNLQNGAQVQVGINRVPFGPGAYGISQSWFFDQHYYVGLADDMDMGVKYSTTFGSMKVDMAFYLSDEGSWVGENFSSDSVRYSYDVVNEGGQGYEENNQFNLRLRKPVDFGDGLASEIGLSLQYGELESNGTQSDGDHYAASVHAVTTLNNWKLATQLTKYSYDVDATQPLGTDALVQFGAFDFPTAVAAKAWIVGASLSYYLETNNIPWLDYMIPFAEYSSIMKEESGYNDSSLITLGTAWAKGGWYIYTEAAWSNGNDFVGNEGGYNQRFGANPNDKWQYRLNMNFGYYF